MTPSKMRCSFIYFPVFLNAHTPLRMSNSKSRENDLLPPHCTKGRGPLTQARFNGMQFVLSGRVPGLLPLLDHKFVSMKSKIGKTSFKKSNWQIEA